MIQAHHHIAHTQTISIEGFISCIIFDSSRHFFFRKRFLDVNIIILRDFRSVVMRPRKSPRVLFPLKFPVERNDFINDDPPLLLPFLPLWWHYQCNYIYGAFAFIPKNFLSSPCFSQMLLDFCLQKVFLPVCQYHQVPSILIKILARIFDFLVSKLPKEFEFHPLILDLENFSVEVKMKSGEPWISKGSHQSLIIPQTPLLLNIFALTWSKILTRGPIGGLKRVMRQNFQV